MVGIGVFLPTPRGFVFDGTSVGAGEFGLDRFSGQDSVKGGGDVVLRFFVGSGIGGADAIDGSHVHENTFGIDHVHVRRGFGVVALSDVAFRIKQDGGGLAFFGGVDLIGLFGWVVALFAGGRGHDGQPDHAFFAIFFLDRWHMAVVVVAFDKGTTVIQPFENHDFSLVLGQIVLFFQRCQKVQRSEQLDPL